MFSHGFLLILNTLWNLFFLSNGQKNRGSGRLEAGMKKGSEKCMLFEWLEPRKVSCRAGGSMILTFCPSPENTSILGLFWYLLLELLGFPILENVVFKGASFLFAFQIDFYTILNPQNLPPRHVKWGFIFGTIFDKPFQHGNGKRD